MRRLGREPLPTHLSPEQLVWFAGGYVVSFLLAGACLLAVVLACHPLSPHDVPVVLGAYAVGFAAALTAFILPGGLGAREVALVAVLSAVMPTLVATAASVAARLIQIVTELLLAALTWFIATRQEARTDRVSASVLPGRAPL
jgi:glycosyltransferase 2 family protein